MTDDRDQGSDDMMVRMARAMAEADFVERYSIQGDDVREAWVNERTPYFVPHARAAWAAAAEPTQLMKNAGSVARYNQTDGSTCEQIYQAMHGAVDV